MYEAKQNKEKVSRRIDGGGGVIHNIGINADTYSKVLNVCRNSLAKKNIQMKDSRAANPYERGNAESPKVHHIISHSKLKKAIKKLTEEEQNEVKCEFLPDFKSLTFRQLKNISPKLEVEIEDSALDVSLESFRGDITIHDERYGFSDITLSAWREEYEKVKMNDIENVSHLQFWKDLKDSYFEWSGGNLFYGPQERVEPGVTNLDEFDEDAQYFRGQSHVGRLKSLEQELDENDKKKDVLIKIGKFSRNFDAGPKYDPQKWFIPDVKQYLLIGCILQSGDRHDAYINSFQNKRTIKGSLPKDLIKNRIDKWITHELQKCKVQLHRYRKSHSLTDKPSSPLLEIDIVRKRNLGDVLKIKRIHTQEIFSFVEKMSNNEIIGKIREILEEEVSPLRQICNLP